MLLLTIHESTNGTFTVPYTRAAWIAAADDETCVDAALRVASGDDKNHSSFREFRSGRCPTLDTVSERYRCDMDARAGEMWVTGSPADDVQIGSGWRPVD